MGVLDNIIKELSKDYITEKIEKPHNEARISFHLSSNSVHDDATFENVIGEYYNHQFTRCISNGGKLSRAEATGRAKEIIVSNYNKIGLNKLNAYSDGKRGERGGMMAMLDIIWKSLIHDAKERHVEEVLDRYIAPSNWEERVNIIKEIFEYSQYPLDVDRNQPEQYASNYKQLIKVIMKSLDDMGDNLR